MAGSTVFLALLGVLASIHALVRVSGNRVPLRVILGPTFIPLVASLLLTVALLVWILVREVARMRRGERRSRPLAPVRALFVVGVLGWAYCLWRVQPPERIWLEIVASIVFGAWGCVVALERVLARLPSGLRRALDFSISTLCASAVLLELTLRAIVAVHPTEILARAGDPPRQVIAEWRMKPGQILMGFPCNRGGHFDTEFRRKAPGEHLAITIGDSFSVGVVPHPYHFTTVCEPLLGCPVYNMGIIGVGPREYLQMLVEEALPLAPDVVVIDVFVGNDLLFDLPPLDMWRERMDSWFDRNHVIACVLPGRLRRIGEERRRLATETFEAGIAPGKSELEQLFPWIENPLLEIGSYSEANFLMIESTRAEQLSGLTPAALAPFHEAMLDIQRAAGSTKLAVMLIPDEFQVDDPLWAQIERSAPAERFDRDRAQTLLLPWFAEQGIPCLDLLPLARAVPPLEDGQRHLYKLRDTHFNVRGNRMAGEALAEFLRPYVAEK
ncbi:MAG TPA: hypothetical protein VGR31_12245 [Planctomycetota bacterium]|jgi:hypothetical protein|nr:hypothetical protein [Planctomycetota bacterium]